MISPNVKWHSWFFIIMFSIWMVEELPAQEIDYRLVPNLQPLQNNSRAPEFNLPDPAGHRVSLSNFRGKIVLLNFWASWCGPCREEMPAMERLYNDFRDKGFVVLGVNVRDKREDTLAAIKDHKLTYPVVFDPTGRWLLAYGAWRLPNTYLIGTEGEPLARMQGHADWYSPGARQLVQARLNKKIK